MRERKSDQIPYLGTCPVPGKKLAALRRRALSPWTMSEKPGQLTNFLSPVAGERVRVRGWFAVKSLDD